MENASSKKVLVLREEEEVFSGGRNRMVGEEGRVRPGGLQIGMVFPTRPVGLKQFFAEGYRGA